MARQPAIEVEGLKEFRRALKNAEVSFDDLKDAGLQAGELVAETARTIVPHLTGALQASIRPAGQASGAVVRAGRSSVPYAAVVHFGDPKRGIEPHPFLYEAVDERADEIEDLYLQRVQAIADKIGG